MDGAGPLPLDAADRRGIRARTLLPLPQYDRLFELREHPRLGTLCVMRPGTLNYDPDYWEEVPT